MKNFIKIIERALARNMFFALRWLISRMPYPIFRIFAFFFSLLGQVFMHKKRKLALENLKKAYGEEKSSEEFLQISKDCFNYFGKGMVDLLYLLDRPKEIIENVKIEGKEILDEALAKGNGVVFVSGHFGSFILMYLRMILEGYKINIIMRRTRDSAFEKHISSFRQEKGMHTIYALPPRPCVQKSLKALRHNEILFILLDQNFGGEGRLFVDFFGQKAATAAGPVVFASRTKSPILSIFIMKDQETIVPKGQLSRNKIVIHPEIVLDEYEDKDEKIYKNVQKITKVIEQQVRKVPSEWGGWMHKRWKSKTVQEQEKIDREIEEDGNNRKKFEKV